MAKGKPWKAYGRYGSIGIELVLSMLLGLFLGYRGDAKFGTKPWLTLLGFAVGCYAGFRQLFVAAKKMERDVEAEETQDRERAEDDARVERWRREAGTPGADMGDGESGAASGGEDGAPRDPGRGNLS
ncbi:MAG: AtpZ/AtpI family protein [Polyangiaceae bacterium]